MFETKEPIVYKNDLLCNVGIINTKNGQRIGSFATNNITGKSVLSYFVNQKEANKLIKRYSELTKIPVFNFAKDN